MKQMPIVNAMQNYAADRIYPLHTPGHKGGRVVHGEFAKFLDKHFWEMDVSLMSELDSLQSPTSCIAEAQTLAAQLYGADYTRFSVNGTSGALQALVLGAFKPQDKVLIARNMHSSLMAALILADIQPIFIQPEFLPEFGMGMQVTVAQVAAAFAAEPNIKGVILTSPSYVGIVADIEQIAKIAQQYGALLLVDEAHGAHFGFSDKFPQSALRLGADAVVQSTHKTLSALTQTSMLHMKKGLLPCERIEQMFSLLMSTSPNQWLLASLDAARYLMQTSGSNLMEHAYTVALDFRKKLNKLQGVQVLDITTAGCTSAYAQDVTKVLANFRRRGYSGVEVGEYLRDYCFAVELVDEYNVLFLLSYAEDSYLLNKLIKCLKMLPPKSERPLINLPKAQIPERVLSVHEAFYAEQEQVRFASAAGRVIAESIAFYPPGVAHIMPGEQLSAQDIEYCQQMIALGVAVNGASDPELNTIRVVK